MFDAIRIRQKDSHLAKSNLNRLCRTAKLMIFWCFATQEHKITLLIEIIVGK